MASVLNVPLASYLPKVTLDNQRGFVKGRVITDNISEIEAEALTAVAEEEQVCALVSFDVQAAFPSLAH